MAYFFPSHHRHPRNLFPSTYLRLFSWYFFYVLTCFLSFPFFTNYSTNLKNCRCHYLWNCTVKYAKKIIITTVLLFKHWTFSWRFLVFKFLSFIFIGKIWTFKSIEIKLYYCYYYSNYCFVSLFIFYTMVFRKMLKRSEIKKRNDFIILYFRKMNFCTKQFFNFKLLMYLRSWDHCIYFHPNFLVS